MIKAKHRATSVKGGIGSYESHTDTHLSLHTLSAGDLKIYSSTYPILRYSYHVSCKVMRQGIAPAACSPSSFYINHSETAHPLSATLFSWSVTKWVVSLFFLFFFFIKYCDNIFEQIDVGGIFHIVAYDFINTAAYVQCGFRLTWSLMSHYIIK